MKLHVAILAAMAAISCLSGASQALRVQPRRAGFPVAPELVVQKAPELSQAERVAIDDILAFIQAFLWAFTQVVYSDLEDLMATAQGWLQMLNDLQAQGVDLQQFVVDLLVQSLGGLLEELGGLVGLPAKAWDDWDGLISIIETGVEGMLDLLGGDLELALLAVQQMIADIEILQEQNPDAWQQQLIDMALATLNSVLSEIESLIEGNPKIRAILNNRDALDDLLVLLQEGLDGILNLVEGNLDEALAFAQNMLDMLLELQAQSGEDWQQQLIDMALQSLGTILGQLEEMLGITPFSKKYGRAMQVYKVMDRANVKKLVEVSFMEKVFQEEIKVAVHKIEKDALEELLVLLEQGLDGILGLVQGNLEEALTLVQNWIDMLLALQALPVIEEWEQQLIDLALQSLGTILGQIEDLLGIAPDFKRLAVSHAKLSKDAFDDLLALIQQGLDGILGLVEGNLDEALIMVQNMLDMLLELQAQSGEDWEQQLIDLALQSLGTILGQIEDLLGIAPDFKRLVLSHAKLPKDAFDDLLVLIQQGLDGILGLVEGNLDEALIMVQNMLDMLLELQAQSGEDWEQQLIDLALQSLGTILGQIEDLLGIAPDFKHLAIGHRELSKDAFDDLLALIQQGLDGILGLVEGNLDEALIMVQNMLDMLLELQAQSGEDWEQQLIDLALQSLGTILGQIEDLLGIAPDFKRLAISHAKLPRDALEDLLALIQGGLDGILSLVEGNLDEALAFVQNMLDMLLELQAQSGEDWEQQLIDLALQSLGTILGQIEDLLGITP